MEDPKVYDILALILDEMRENRKEYRVGIEQLRIGQEQLRLGQERQEILLQRQIDTLEQFFHTVAAPQASQIHDLETKQDELQRRVEVLERKMAA